MYGEERERLKMGKKRKKKGKMELRETNLKKEIKRKIEMRTKGERDGGVNENQREKKKRDGRRASISNVRATEIRRNQNEIEKEK